MRTQNEPLRFKTVPLALVPPHRSYDEPFAIILRTDDDLVQAAQSGDHEAFAELCRRHARAAKRRILAIRTEPFDGATTLFIHEVGTKLNRNAAHCVEGVGEE